MNEAAVQALDDALALGDTIVVVRSGAAIAEVAGGSLRRGEDWLTVGEEGPGGSHVHIKLTEVHALRFRETDSRNAALDVLAPDGTPIFSVSFRKTNPGRAETFDPARLAAVRSRFAHLVEAQT